MNIIARLVAIPGLLACSAACGLAADRDPGDIYTGGPYEGRVSAQVLVPDEPRDGKKDSGTGSAQFIAIGKGRSRLVVKANIRRPGDSGFAMEGSANVSGWSGRAGDLRLDIDSNGNISGGGVENRHRIVFGGRATAESFDLTVETEKLMRTGQEVLPAGTRILFDYDLGRTRANTNAGAAATAVPDKKQKTCKRRVWKARNVATPGGGMTMIQVPHCLD